MIFIYEVTKMSVFPAEICQMIGDYLAEIQVNREMSTYTSLNDLSQNDQDINQNDQDLNDLADVDLDQNIIQTDLDIYVYETKEVKDYPNLSTQINLPICSMRADQRVIDMLYEM